MSCLITVITGTIYRVVELGFVQESAVKLPDGRFINANQIKSLGGANFIATQGPLKKQTMLKASSQEKQKMKDETREDFLYMILSKEAEYVVQLAPWLEKNEYGDERDLKKKLKEIAGCYYKDKPGQSKEIGQYTVTTKSMDTIEGGIEKRELILTDSK